MSDRLEDATPQEPTEATQETAVPENVDSESSASEAPQTEAAASEGEEQAASDGGEPQASEAAAEDSEVTAPAEGEGESEAEAESAATAETAAEEGAESGEATAASDEPTEVEESTEAAAEESAEAAAEEPAAEPAEAEAAAEESTEAAAEEPTETAAEEPTEAAAEEPAEAAAEEPAEAVAEEPAEESAEAEAAAETSDEAEAAGAEEAAAEAEVEAASESTVEAAAEAESSEEAAGEEGGENSAAAEAAAASEGDAEAASDATETEASEQSTEEAAASSDESEAEQAEAAASDAKAEATAAMTELEEAMAKKQPVKGQVIGWNKGGYHVAIGKIAAFCPVSQIEIGNPRSPKRYLDKTFSFRIIEIQNGGRRVVLSRAEAIKDEREQKAALVRELLQPGVELEGKVSSLTSFGAFVDLGGGIEGLVHVSEISRRRVEHPKEALKTGQKVRVTVLKIEKGGQRISLSMKRLEPDPWKGVAERFPEGSQFSGKVLRQTDFGVFVEVEPGLEGLVHTSRLALGMKLSDESLEVGKEVSGWIHEVEAKRRRLSLSLREVAGGNPWKGIHDRFPVGEVVKGTVERLANFGVFIMLEPGLTGLLPFSVLGNAAGNPKRQYHVGKEVSVRVLGIDRDKRRISLGTESSKAEGNEQDFREYKKSERGASSGGLNAMAAAFAKLKEQQRQQA
ncbi:MAG: S1 RNA-binding domain-containing protein [Acidobacteriota bacterium]